MGLTRMIDPEDKLLIAGVAVGVVVAIVGGVIVDRQLQRTEDDVRAGARYLAHKAESTLSHAEQNTFRSLLLQMISGGVLR